MTLSLAIVIGGSAMAVLGVLLLISCVRRAAVLRQAEADAAKTHAELQKLIAMNMAGVFLGFMGLGIVVVGVLLS
ncbi:MAG: hypothetical protein AAF415_00685 [Pseudomonadota bacterium]